MVTNFDYLKNESKFSAFANVAICRENYIGRSGCEYS